MNLDHVVDLAAQLRANAKDAEKYIADVAKRAEMASAQKEALDIVERVLQEKTAALYELEQKHAKLAADFDALRKQVLGG